MIFDSEIYYLLAFFSSLIISFFLMPVIIHISKKHQLGAQSELRSSHSGIIPNLGGIPIAIAIILSSTLYGELDAVRVMTLCFILTFILGVLDDLTVIGAYKKLFIQIFISLILVFYGNLRIDSFHGVLGVYELPYFVSILFSVFVFIVITNGYNLIDGIDGLASGLGIIAATIFGFCAMYMNQYNIAVLAFSLTGALFGFLKYNYHPAKIFMGDTGSLLIGLIFSILAVNMIKYSIIDFNNVDHKNSGPLIAISFLAIPLFDSLRVFIIRIKRGDHPLRAGKDHIHHNLLGLGFDHKKTSYILYCFALIIILLTYILMLYNININYSIAILALISFLFLYIPFYKLRVKK